MTSIRQFVEVRRDGRVMDESMTLDKMLSLGWPPSEVVEIRWHGHDRELARRSDLGILAIVVPGGEFIAAIEAPDGKPFGTTLSVLNADGTVRFELPDVLAVQGRERRGMFRWFGPPRVAGPNVFGVVFDAAGDSVMFRLDVEAASGRIVGVCEAR